MQESFEDVQGVADRTPVRFLDFFKAFRQIYSIKLTKDEAVLKLNSKSTIPAAKSLVNPELLEEAKKIIEAITMLKEINELKWPPVLYDLSMTHLVSHLVHHTKDVRDPEALIRIMPAQLR